jgi:hypothetical protein
MDLEKNQKGNETKSYKAGLLVGKIVGMLALIAVIISLIVYFI